MALTNALAYLHGQGLIHRDIKPSNIILVGGMPKLADVGLVAGVDDARSYVGTEGFIPPEGPGSPQADLYSLGIVLYEMSTGKSHQDFPEPLPDLAGQPDHARWLEFNAVVHKACVSDVRERYQSAKEMHAELELLQRGESVGGKQAVERRFALAKKLSMPAAVFAGLIASGWLLSTRFNALTLLRSNAPLEANSIAVLPFLNESKLRQHEYLSDALTEETMNALTNFAGLRVAPRPAVFAFNRATNDLRQIGERLGVCTVLAGSMKKSSNQLHVAARLIRVADGSNMWSGSFDREAQDIGAIQSEVVRQVARRLNLSIDERALRRLETNLVRKQAAYQLVRQSQSTDDTQDGLNKTIELLNRAIVEDPECGWAYARLAHFYAEISGIMLPPEQAMTEAKKNALRAIQLDDSLAEAHMALGNVLLRHELDFAKAEAEFRHAIEVEPRYVDSYGFYATMLSQLGRFGEAEQVLKQGERYFPNAQIIHAGWCWRYYLNHRFDDLLQETTNYLSILTSHPVALMFRGWAHEQLGNYDDALVTAQTMVRMDPTPDWIAFLGRVHARMGHRDEAQKALEQLRVLAQGRRGWAVYDAQVLLALGDNDGAIKHLQQAVADYPPTVLQLITDPLWDGLRSDPRFIALVKKLGLKK